MQQSIVVQAPSEDAPQKYWAVNYGTTTYLKLRVQGMLIEMYSPIMVRTAQMAH